MTFQQMGDLKIDDVLKRREPLTSFGVMEGSVPVYVFSVSKIDKAADAFHLVSLGLSKLKVVVDSQNLMDLYEIVY